MSIFPAIHRTIESPMTGRLIAFFLFTLLSGNCATPPDLRFSGLRSAISDAAFRRSVSGIGNRELLRGNKIELLEQSDETFNKMFRLLRGARRTINIEMYLLEDDAVGKKLVDILGARVKDGVRVNVLIDYIGGRYAGSLPDRMQELGIDFRFFRAPMSDGSINERTHRKLVIVDGRYGMTGGFGISEYWLNQEDPESSARDLQAFLRGPIVFQMQSVFLENWQETTGELLTGDEYFPELNPEGNVTARFIGSKPHRGSSAARKIYLYAIHSARKYIWMEQSYFLPDRAARRALIDAVKRGVDVRILVPALHTTDIPMVSLASHSYYKQLLKGGVRLYAYQKKHLHSKFAVADDIWSAVGSTNFDNRSFKLSREAGLDIYDRRIARRLKNIVLEDLKDSIEITLEDHQARPWSQKIKERFYRMFESQL